jgi:hypothetical protein
MLDLSVHKPQLGGLQIMPRRMPLLPAKLAVTPAQVAPVFVLHPDISALHRAAVQL